MRQRHGKPTTPALGIVTIAAAVTILVLGQIVAITIMAGTTVAMVVTVATMLAVEELLHGSNTTSVKTMATIIMAVAIISMAATTTNMVVTTATSNTAATNSKVAGITMEDIKPKPLLALLHGTKVVRVVTTECPLRRRLLVKVRLCLIDSDEMKLLAC